MYAFPKTPSFPTIFFVLSLYPGACPQNDIREVYIMNELKKAIIKTIMACDDMVALRLIYTFITKIVR